MIVPRPNLSRLNNAKDDPRRAGKYYFVHIGKGASPEQAAYPIQESRAPKHPPCKSLVGLLLEDPDGGRVLAEFQDYAVRLYTQNVTYDKTLDLVSLRNVYGKQGLYFLFSGDTIDLPDSIEFTAVIVNPTLNDYLSLGLGHMVVYSPAPSNFHTQRRLVGGSAVYFPDLFSLLAGGGDNIQRGDE